jgi:hypothetical protein
MRQGRTHDANPALRHVRQLTTPPHAFAGRRIPIKRQRRRYGDRGQQQGRTHGGGRVVARAPGGVGRGLPPFRPPPEEPALTTEKAPSFYACARCPPLTQSTLPFLLMFDHTRVPLHPFLVRVSSASRFILIFSLFFSPACTDTTTNSYLYSMSTDLIEVGN